MRSILAMVTFVHKFSILLLILIASIQMQGYESCEDRERIGLLKLKSFFGEFETSDCCVWEGVKCNATTRRVMELSLNNSFIDGSSSFLNLSSFLPFEDLQTLDLSQNTFEGFYENEGYETLGTLKKLKILNIGGNYFNDSVLPFLNTLTSLTTLIMRSNEIQGLEPKQGLANLRNLQVLDLTGNKIGGSLISLGLTNLTNLKRLLLGDCGITTIQGLANLTELEVLDLSKNNINLSATLSVLAELKNLEALALSSNNINGSLESQGICYLKNLFELDVSRNNFEGNLPECLNNLSRLKVLDISSNQLTGNLPSVIANLTSLEYLALSNNNFRGEFSLCSLANHSNLKVFLLLNTNNNLSMKIEDCLPAFQLKVLQLPGCKLGVMPGFLFNQYSLKFLDLSHNKLVGNPSWLLRNNTKLEALYLTNNSFTGNLQLPNFKLDLLHVDISRNSFTGVLPLNFGTTLQDLAYIDISRNGFEGNVPASIGEMKELHVLDFSRNNFSGELPQSIVSGCFSLDLLALSNNNFQGQFFSKHMNLTQLKWLYLENNHFSGKIEDGLLNSDKLHVLEISNNMFSGYIPNGIGNLTTLSVLSMADNHLMGNLPPQFNNLGLDILDVSGNSLSSRGMISSFNLSSLKHLYMQKNDFSGPIPETMFESSELMTLDLRENKFFGRIPHRINKDSNLRVLLLRGNYLQGPIPDQLCQLRNLGILDLSQNRLNGSIPSCFANVLFWTVGNDDLYGSEREYIWGLDASSVGTYYTPTLDLSSLEGGFTTQDQQVGVEIESKSRYETFNGSSLDYMTALDLSCNELTGEIPSEIGKFRNIRGLNLSHNSLSGSIPLGFHNLKMLESLDLSHNKLSGQIPPQMSELSFLSDFDVSYNNLSGLIPDKGQFGTFYESSYRGNLGLCGPTINKSCGGAAEEIPATATTSDEEDESAIDTVTLYWAFGASYVTVILGLFAILWFNSYWRRIWFYFIDECIDWCYFWLMKFVNFIRSRTSS